MVDEGETVQEALGREVLEETGLHVTTWDSLAYEVRADAPEMNWSLSVEVYRAVDFEGELCWDADPDGIVVAAEFADLETCDSRLSGGHEWVREPVLTWLGNRESKPRFFHYRIDGTWPSDIRVHRL